MFYSLFELASFYNEMITKLLKAFICAGWFASLSLYGAAYVRRPVTTAICYDVIFSN